MHWLELYTRAIQARKEQVRDARRAAWALSINGTQTPPPAGISPARWRAMVRHVCVNGAPE